MAHATTHPASTTPPTPTLAAEVAELRRQVADLTRGLADVTSKLAEVARDQSATKSEVAGVKASTIRWWWGIPATLAVLGFAFGMMALQIDSRFNRVEDYLAKQDETLTEILERTTRLEERTTPTSESPAPASEEVIRPANLPNPNPTQNTQCHHPNSRTHPQAPARG